MTLKEISKIQDTLSFLGDFTTSNSDGDESGIAEEMDEKYNEAMKILEDEKYKLHLRNALAKLKRKQKL